MRTKRKRQLTPSQAKVKRPRPIYYTGPYKNADYEFGRDAINLYLVCGLGYSPIRHILGEESDKKIEDIMRQHNLGRKAVSGEDGELFCPGVSKLSETTKATVLELCSKYGTSDDPYIVKMLKEERWSDDPKYVYPSKCSCGIQLEKGWKICPMCGERISKAS